ncbi:MAG: RNA-binding S4 domain-containing protein [Bacteroidetes bacterium]|nr:RNA-binding S4 domain-containing protein [Bacteroidota bacterium]
MNLEKVRIDKFLWGIRLYKTRTLATEACDSGKVKIDGDNAKPSKLIKVGDIIKVRIEHHVKTIKVVKLLEKRVGAPIAIECYEDLTPESEKPSFIKSAFHMQSGTRDRGAGRPTKHDRREIDQFTGLDD